MRLPSWNDFVGKLSDFEHQAKSAIQEFREDHPILDKVITNVIPLLPPPLNAIAEQIIRFGEGDDVDKTNEMLGYFNFLKSKGENHYNTVCTKMDNVLIAVTDVKEITAKQATLVSIKDTLISSTENIEKRIDDVKNKLNDIEANIGNRMDNLGNSMSENQKETMNMFKQMMEKLDKNNITSNTAENTAEIKNLEKLL